MPPPTPPPEDPASFPLNVTFVSAASPSVLKSPQPARYAA
jgi:hypothetical protein